MEGNRACTGTYKYFQSSSTAIWCTATHCCCGTNIVSLFRFGHVMYRFRRTRGRLPARRRQHRYTRTRRNSNQPRPLAWRTDGYPHVFLYLLYPQCARPDSSKRGGTVGQRASLVPIRVQFTRASFLRAEGQGPVRRCRPGDAHRHIRSPMDTDHDLAH